ncbi:MAG: sugar ABC transporter substrate-binding protein [Chloroflexi bacterium]|nr:sugar ABC transporter substrate-binding protein [Chloroflexota bacterium]
MSRKSVSIIIGAILALSMLLSSCAPAAVATLPAPQVIEKTVIVAGTPQTVVVTATPEPKPPEVVTIKFTHLTWMEAGIKVLNDAIADFEAKNPNIKIEQSIVGWGEAHSQFVTSLAGGVAPDIQMLGTPWNNEFYQMGALAPGDEYLPADFKDRFLDSALESVVFDGKIYGIPWEGADWGFYYRKDLFEKAGLDPNTPPKTWDELVEFAKKLTVKENGKVVQWGLEIPAGGWEGDDYFDQFLWAAGNEIAKPNDQGVWASTLSEPSALQAFKFYYDLTNTYKVMPSDVIGKTWEDVKNDFVFGKAAMIYDGGWTTGVIKDTAKEIEGKWAGAIPPAGPSGSPVTLGYPNTLVVTAQSKHPKEAYQFLEFLQTGSPSWADQYCLVHASFNWTKAYVESDFAKDPLIVPLAQSLAISKNKPYAPDYEKFRMGYFVPAIQSLLKGELTPEQASTQLTEAFNKIHGAQ